MDHWHITAAHSSPFPSRHCIHLTDKGTEDPYAQLYHIGLSFTVKAMFGHLMVNEVDSSHLQILSFYLGNG